MERCRGSQSLEEAVLEPVLSCKVVRASSGSRASSHPVSSSSLPCLSSSRSLSRSPSPPSPFAPYRSSSWSFLLCDTSLSSSLPLLCFRGGPSSSRGLCVHDSRFLSRRIRRYLCHNRLLCLWLRLGLRQCHLLCFRLRQSRLCFFSYASR